MDVADLDAVGRIERRHLCDAVIDIPEGEVDVLRMVGVWAVNREIFPQIGYCRRC